MTRSTLLLWVLLFALAGACEAPPQPGLYKYTELATGDDDRLVVLLHGYGSNEKDLVGLAREVGLTGPLVSFRAPLSAGSGYAWFPIDFNAEPRYPPNAADAVLPRVASNIRRAALQQTAREVVVLGFSQGAMLTAMLAAEHPRVLTHAVVLSGGLPRPVKPVAGDVKVFVAHGDADDVVPVQRGRDLAAQLEAAGRQVSFTEVPGMRHTVGPPVQQALKAWLAEQAVAPAAK